MDRMKRRQDFVAAAKAPYAALPSLILQRRNRGDDGPARIGFTATRKIGNAVTRNRVKRRLRAAAQQVLPDHACPGHDYVLIGRATTAGAPYGKIIEDLNAALRRLDRAPHQGPDRG